MADGKPAAPARAETPVGVNHLVINVRDIEESHKFWTEIVGLKQVGALRPGTPEAPRPVMRFYSADHDGQLNHHDIALVENKDLPPPPKDWRMFGTPVAINHIAITLPNREAWLRQLAFVQSRGIKFERRVNHGMTRSLYISDPNGYGVELLYELPREMWEADIDTALNWAENLPTEGEAALVDEIDKAPRFGSKSKVAAE
ncbi:MAG TPA: VOC family protein [Stellaceae bacterium]|nr:VOC family protein [Stellaceae bacterium]